MKNRAFPYLAIFALWFLFSLPFFVRGNVPFASDYQNNFFSPWGAYSQNAGPVKNNAQPDIITQIYPWRYYDLEELKNGRLPLWNPYSFAGTPHLANYQSAVFFPLNILFFLPVPFIDIWSVLVLLQPLLAGIFMYMLLRVLKVSKSGSLLSSFSFMFCGFITTWMGYATLGYAILPLPLALFFVEKFANGKKQIYLIFLSLTFLCSFFSGHFQTSLYFSFAVIGFIIYHLIFSKEKKIYLECLFFSLTGLLLSMPQIIPSIEFYSLSLRSGLFQKIEAIPWSYLPTLFSPDFYGNPVTRNDWFGHYAEWNGYLGIIGISLSFFTIFFKRNKNTSFFIILALVSLLLSFDTPLLSLLVYFKLPVLSTSADSRIIALFSFSMAVLAGFGFDALVECFQKNYKNRVFVWMAFMIAIIGILIFVAFGGILQFDKALIAKRNLVLPVLILVIFLMSVLAVIVLKSRKFILVFVVIAVVLSGVEMYRFASKWQNFSPSNLVYKDVPIVKFYQQMNHLDRALGPSGGEDAVYYKIPILSGYDPLYKEEYGKFVQYVADGRNEEPERSVVNFPLSGKYTPQAINFLGVKYIVVKVSDLGFSWAFPFAKYPNGQFSKVYDDKYYQVFKNNYAFPRVFTVSDVKTIDDENKILDFMFAHNLRETAVVSSSIKGLSHNASGSAAIVQYSPGKVDIKASVSGKSLLILTDNFYPGWRVKVDGKPSKIIKTDYSFRGVVIPKGTSNIEFYYLPESFLIGVYLFLIGILGMTVNFIYKKFKRIE
jgi:hypothetical protein